MGGYYDLDEILMEGQVSTRDGMTAANSAFIRESITWMELAR